MHRQIKVVAILLMVEGGLESLMGIFLTVMGPVMMTILKDAPTTSSGSPPPPALFGAIYIVMGVATLHAGIIKVVAGIRNVSFKSRMLGFIGLGSCLLSFASCYCIPTALGVGIYGLIVYINEKSAQAFQMGDSGMPADQIVATLDGMGAGYPQQQQQQYPPPPPYPPQFPR
jgi:hypothetical protein